MLLCFNEVGRSSRPLCENTANGTETSPLVVGNIPVFYSSDGITGVSFSIMLTIFNTGILCMCLLARVGAN